MTTSMLPNDAPTILRGRYVLVEPIGAGGAARVFRSVDRVAQTEVAVKLLRAPLDAADAARTLKRFEREVNAAAAVSHAAFVPTLDHGVADDRYFIVQPLLVGQTLEARLSEGPIEPAELERLFEPVLQALSEAHARGVVHRDLTPANLFIEAEHGRLRVLDFGVAYLESDERRVTRTGEFLGTPRYMAPESVSRGQVGPPMDVYQIALVLAEALGGQPLADGETAYACMKQHASGDLSLPEALNQVPWGDTVRRALAPDPDHRPTVGTLFQSAAPIHSGGRGRWWPLWAATLAAALIMSHSTTTVLERSMPAVETPVSALSAPLVPTPESPTPLVDHGPPWTPEAAVTPRVPAVRPKPRAIRETSPPAIREASDRKPTSTFEKEAAWRAPF